MAANRQSAATTASRAPVSATRQGPFIAPGRRGWLQRAVAGGLLPFGGMEEERSFQERLQAAWSRLRAAAGEVGRRVRGGLAALWRPFAERRGPRLALAVVLAVGFALALVGGAAWQTCGFQGCPDAARLAAYRAGGAAPLVGRQGEGDGTP